MGDLSAARSCARHCSPKGHYDARYMGFEQSSYLEKISSLEYMAHQVNFDLELNFCPKADNS